jgi:hypothetical protein
MQFETQRRIVTLRRMQLLVALLVFSNLFVGFYSIHLIRRTDREYSGLIDESVPVISETRHAGQQAGFAYRSIVAGLVTRDPLRCSAMLQRAKSSLANAREIRAHDLRDSFFQEYPALADEFKASGEAFEAAATDMLPRMFPENSADAERERMDRLLSLYERHVASVEKIVTAAVSRAETTSDLYSNENQGQARIVMGLASWPLLVLGFGIAVAASMAIFMLFVFRRAVIVDEP